MLLIDLAGLNFTSRGYVFHKFLSSSCETLTTLPRNMWEYSWDTCDVVSKKSLHWCSVFNLLRNLNTGEQYSFLMNVILIKLKNQISSFSFSNNLYFVSIVSCFVSGSGPGRPRWAVEPMKKKFVLEAWLVVCACWKKLNESTYALICKKGDQCLSFVR